MTEDAFALGGWEAPATPPIYTSDGAAFHAAPKRLGDHAWDVRGREWIWLPDGLHRVAPPPPPAEPPPLAEAGVFC